MKCYCGLPFVRSDNHKESLVEIEMNERHILRKCSAGHGTRTVELVREELARIRRLAHLQVMSEVRR